MLFFFGNVSALLDNVPAADGRTVVVALPVAGDGARSGSCPSGICGTTTWQIETGSQAFSDIAVTTVTQRATPMQVPQMKFFAICLKSLIAIFVLLFGVTARSESVGPR